MPVALSDGRKISALLARFSRLLHATQSRTASGGIHRPSFLHDPLRQRHQYTLRGQQGGGGQIQKLKLPVGS